MKKVSNQQQLTASRALLTNDQHLDAVDQLAEVIQSLIKPGQPFNAALKLDPESLRKIVLDSFDFNGQPLDIDDKAQLALAGAQLVQNLNLKKHEAFNDRYLLGGEDKAFQGVAATIVRAIVNVVDEALDEENNLSM